MVRTARTRSRSPRPSASSARLHASLAFDSENWNQVLDLTNHVLALDPLKYGDVTGYFSVRYGPSQLERTYNDYLDGRATALIPQNLIDEILGRPKRGANIVTTILCSCDSFCIASFNLFCNSERFVSRTGSLVAVSSRNSATLPDASFRRSRRCFFLWRPRCKYIQRRMRN